MALVAYLAAVALLGAAATGGAAADPDCPKPLVYFFAAITAGVIYLTAITIEGTPQP